MAWIAMFTVACGPPKTEPDTADDIADETAEEAADETAEETTEETASDGSAEASETGDDPSTTATFAPREDAMIEADCDFFAQDCAEGEKCVSYPGINEDWASHKCVPVSGDQAAGEPCVSAGQAEATDDCDQNSMCWNIMQVDGELVGTCHAFCTGSFEAPECSGNSSCSVSGSGSISLCMPHCDPIGQDCDPGTACYWEGDQFFCSPTTQNIPAGESCGFINDCAVGLICLAPELFPACEGLSCCSAFCQLELGDGPCDEVLPGTSCVAFFEQDMAPPGYEQVGVCVVPS